MSTLGSGLVKKTSSYNADPRSIVRKPGFNRRFDFGDIKELEDSIKANGFFGHKPLLVIRVGDKLELIDGDRRLTAVENLMKKGHKFDEGIPIELADKKIDEQQRLILQYTANTGKPFNPLEEAALFKSLKDGERSEDGTVVIPGLTIKQICAKVGRSDVHVQEALSLVEAAPEVTKALAEGKVSATLAKQIATKAKGDTAKQAELVKTASTGKAGKKLAAEQAQQIQRRRPNAAALAKPVMMTQPATQVLLERIQGLLDSDISLFNLKDTVALRSTVAKDDKLVAAYRLGVVQALQLVLGNKVTVDI